MKTVILYSGGLDSYAMLQLARANSFAKVVCLNVNLGHPYAHKEASMLVTQSMAGVFDGTELRTLDFNELNDFAARDRKDDIIPYRNLLLMTLGAMIGDQVWLGALDGEQLGAERDKSGHFLDSAEALISWLGERVKGDRTLLRYPLGKLTKTRVVEMLKDRGKAEEAFELTSSCYGEGGHCGSCLACFKRWAAFKMGADIEKPDIYGSPPWESDYASELRGKIGASIGAGWDSDRFTATRVHDFRKLEARMITEGRW